MASEADIAEVRSNINDDSDEPMFDDEYISAKIDELGVPNASAALWRAKAAEYSELVDTSEGGASRALGDLHKNALNMAKTFDTVGAAEVAATRGSPMVKKIVRE